MGLKWSFNAELNYFARNDRKTGRVYKSDCSCSSSFIAKSQKAL